MEENKIKEIKKALEICSNDVDDCDVCPYFKKCSYDDRSILSKDILELIAHYESELGRLDDLVNECIDDNNEWVSEACHLTNTKKNLEHLLSAAYDRIEELDKLGEWIPIEEYNDTFGVNIIHHYICSNCGELKYVNNDKYCFNCGTRMKERKE